MTEYKKVENDPKFIRDMSSQAILNTDIRAFKAYKKKKMLQEIQEERINKLEEGMDEIKTLLKQILEK